MNLRVGLASLLIILFAQTAVADGIQFSRGERNTITLVVREAPVAEVFEMLASKERVNIVLGSDLEGTVSVNLFDVSVNRAIRAVADAAGYVAERRRGGWAIVERDDAGVDTASGNTRVRSFRVQYSDPQKVSDILTKHLSRYGELTVFPERRLIVVEDLPDFLQRVERLLEEIDAEPRQILIETKILEITLDDNETYGINWTQFLQDGEVGDAGVQGLSALGSPGFFFDFVKVDNLEVALNALSDQGRVRTLSTPVLLAIENTESEVVIGDRLGFRVTTTINQVTTESVEFLESGVILRFTASVDRKGRVMLQIHPEVSTGSISDGLPNQTTAEVTTQLLAEDGQTVFLGGLIKDRVTQNHSGARWIKDIPVLGWLASRREDLALMTETIVVVTPHVVNGMEPGISQSYLRKLEDSEAELAKERRRVEERFETPDVPTAAEPAPAP